MDTMGSKNRKRFQREAQAAKSYVEEKIKIAPSSAEHDLLDMALKSIDIKIHYPTNEEWQELRHKVVQHTSEKELRTGEIIDNAINTAMARPEASEWAALQRKVRERVMKPKEKRLRISRVLEPFRATRRAFNVDAVAFFLIFAFCTIFSLAIAYNNISFATTEVQTNIIKPIEERTIQINELISGESAAVILSKSKFNENRYG